MRIISENDVRVTIFACVRPSTVSVMKKKVLIASMAERLRPSAHQLATQALSINPLPPPNKYYISDGSGCSIYERACMRGMLKIMCRTKLGPN